MPSNTTLTSLNVMAVFSAPLKVGTLAGFREDTANASDLDFVFALAYRALEYEADEARSEQAKQQVAFLLDRLVSLDWRQEAEKVA